MTSKISFFKLARDEYRKLAWLTALMGIVFGLFIPFFTLFSISSLDLSKSDPSYHSSISRSYWEFQAAGRWEITLLVLGAGVLCALCAFAYLHSPSKLDFFHSLPLKRRKLFAAKCLGSAMTFAVPFLVCQCLFLLIGVLYGVSSAQRAAAVLLSTVQELLYFLVSYGSALIALMLTGNMLTTVFALGAFLLYGPMVYLLIFSIRNLFLFTSLEDLFPSFYSVARFSSPWTYCLIMSLSYRKDSLLTIRWPAPLDLLALLLLAALLFLISLLIYQRRKTECAGSALAFSWTESLIKFAAAVPVSLFAGLIAYSYYERTVWAFVYILLFGILSCVILEFIYHRDIRQVLRRPLPMGLSLAVALPVFCLFRYDLTGYNTWLPKQDKIASMAVLSSYDNYGDPRILFGEKGMKIDCMETADFEPLYRIAQAGVEAVHNGSPTLYGGETRASEHVTVKYHLKDGREAYRQYQVPYSLFLECMDEMMENPDFRDAYFPILREDIPYSGYAEIDLPETYLDEYRKSEKTGSAKDPVSLPADTELADQEEEPWTQYVLEGEQYRQFLEAYRRDFSRITYTELQEAQGDVSFYLIDKDDIVTAPHYSIDKNFTESMDFLASLEPQKSGEFSEDAIVVG